MKKFLSTAAFCTLLLGACLYIVRPTSSAGEDLAMQLLELPAPPPLNPLVDNSIRSRPDSFYDPTKPPPDDASIEDLVDYWTSDSLPRYGVQWNPRPSSRSLSRLLGETANDPSLLPRLMAVLPDDKATGDFVKRYYDQLGDKGEGEDSYGPMSMRTWLTNNTGYFADDLYRSASRVKDTGNYVSPEDDSLRSLARVDWERARPIVEKLYNNRAQPNSRVAALWAMYRHALDTDSLDADKYRDELKELVSDRNQSSGVRDIANDALTLEREFPGRDEWFISLFEDETFLAIEEYTGITTLVNNSPPDKFVPLLIPLLEKENIVIRSAAARNLLVLLAKERNEERQKVIIKALLPWLTKADWLNEGPQSRVAVVRALASVKLPESVQPLIAALDEKMLVDADDPLAYRYGVGYSANVMSNAVNAVANAMNAAANAAGYARSSNSNSSVNRPKSNAPKVTVYPLRSEAITALGHQGDMRAVPHLKRMLNIVESHEKIQTVKAIFLCNGFSIAEQVEAIEENSRATANLRDMMEQSAVNGAGSPEELISYAMRMAIANTSANRAKDIPFPTTGDPLKLMIAMNMASLEDPSNALVNAAAMRISQLEKPEPDVATSMREFVCRWKGRTVNAFILNDLKNNKVNTTGVIRLLTDRKDIGENQGELVANAGAGSPFAAGIGACLMNSAGGFDEILNKGNSDTVISLLACSRLVRAELPVPLVAKLLKSTDKRQALAAERYLDSEDSVEARAAVTAIYPNQGRINGASRWFKGGDSAESKFGLVSELFISVHPFFSNQYALVGGDSVITADEKRLQKEVTSDSTLLAVYSLDKNFVRVYKDGAMFSWEDDPSRYRERKLTSEEFDAFRDILVENNAGDLKPFLSCRRYCAPIQLLMLSKENGRRVYAATDRNPRVFIELAALFKDFRSKPAKLRYWLEKEIPGLEIIYADDDKRALSVWKNGEDLRIVATDIAAMKKRQAEAREAEENEEPVDEDAAAMSADETTDGEEGSGEDVSEYDYDYLDVSWFSVHPDGSATVSTQPEAVEYIPPPGIMSDYGSQDRWKMRAGNIELRVTDKGISKIAGARTTEISKGRYLFPVITPNAKWFVASHYDADKETSGLVRFNLQTNRRFPVAGKGLDEHAPVAFVPTSNKVLVAERTYEHDHEDESDTLSYRPGSYFFLDAETGALTEAKGEFGPIVQQNFRPLQASGKANEFWAAIEGGAKNETKVGLYDMRTFTFKPILTLPRIKFDSMDMWVDEGLRKVYFVYKGHLLAIPLDARPAGG